MKLRPFLPKGLTLIEVAVVMAVMILLTALTVPGFGDFLRRREFERAVDIFLAEARSAQSKAQSGVVYTPATNVPSTTPRDTWGIRIYCAGAGNSTAGRYEILYVFMDPNGPGPGATPRIDVVSQNTATGARRNLDLNITASANNTSASRFTFAIRSAPSFICAGTGSRNIFFERFTGLGNTTIGEFVASQSIFFDINYAATGYNSVVRMYRNGKIISE